MLIQKEVNKISLEFYEMPYYAIIFTRQLDGTTVILAWTNYKKTSQMLQTLEVF